MAPIVPKNFRIDATAKAKIVLIWDEMTRFDSSQVWLPAIVWSVGDSLIDGGPSIAVYAAKEIATDQRVMLDNLQVVFPNADQSHFENKRLCFDSGSSRFFLIELEAND